MRCTPNFSMRFFDVYHNSNDTVFSVTDYGRTAFTYVNKSKKGYMHCISIKRKKNHTYQHKKQMFSKAANT